MLAIRDSAVGEIFRFASWPGEDVSPARSSWANLPVMGGGGQGPGNGLATPNQMPARGIGRRLILGARKEITARGQGCEPCRRMHGRGCSGREASIAASITTRVAVLYSGVALVPGQVSFRSRPVGQLTRLPECRRRSQPITVSAVMCTLTHNGEGQLRCSKLGCIEICGSPLPCEMSQGVS